MDISVVVCTKDRAKYLPQMLQSLQHLKAPGILWEVVFVDNGSSDATAQILKNFCDDSSMPARVLQEPEQGLSAARNTGWKAATGTIISFTDDDCYPNENWLVAINQAFQDSKADYVGGRVLLFDSCDAPVTIQTLEETIVFPKNSYIESGYIMGANFSCKKEMLDATGGFDKRLGAGTSLRSGEDTDLLIRASLSGFGGFYEPSIIVYHHHRRRLDAEVKRLNSGYACGRGALSMKTILESNAKMLYLKNWYWRIRHLARERKFNQCFNEFVGALRFITVSKF
jgi:glycosyltransferase involved in cell wall biosynthesis